MLIKGAPEWIRPVQFVFITFVPQLHLGNTIRKYAQTLQHNSIYSRLTNNSSLSKGSQQLFEGTPYCLSNTKSHENIGIDICATPMTYTKRSVIWYQHHIADVARVRNSVLFRALLWKTYQISRVRQHQSWTSQIRDFFFQQIFIFLGIRSTGALILVDLIWFIAWISIW